MESLLILLQEVLGFVEEQHELLKQHDVETILIEEKRNKLLNKVAMAVNIGQTFATGIYDLIKNDYSDGSLVKNEEEVRENDKELNYIESEIVEERLYIPQNEYIKQELNEMSLGFSNHIIENNHETKHVFCSKICNTQINQDNICETDTHTENYSPMKGLPNNEYKKQQLNDKVPYMFENNIIESKQSNDSLKCLNNDEEKHCHLSLSKTQSNYGTDAIISVNADNRNNYTLENVCKSQNSIISDKKYKVAQCKICNKLLSNKSILARHMMIHTGEKPFKCLICHRSYGRKSTLNDHMRIHAGQKNFTCDICLKSFTLKSYLKAHVLARHSGMKYKCTICNKSYSLKSSLYRHNSTFHAKGMQNSINFTKEVS